jgi:hypothetical protein
MNKLRKHEAAAATNVFQFTLAGLIVFSLALMAAAALLTYKLTVAGRPKLVETFAVDPKDKTRCTPVRGATWSRATLIWSGRWNI